MRTLMLLLFMITFFGGVSLGVRYLLKDDLKTLSLNDFFHDRKSAEPAGNENDNRQQPTQSGPSEEQAANSDDIVSIKKAEYDDLQARLRKLTAEYEGFKIEVDSKVEAAKANEVQACNEKISSALTTSRDEIMKEARLIVSEANEQIKKFRYNTAVVTGECLCEKKGRLRYHCKLINHCLSVIESKISDGEMTGIQEGISREAQGEGVVSIECNIGQASILPINVSCSDYAKSNPPSNLEAPGDIGPAKSRLDVEKSVEPDAKASTKNEPSTSIKKSTPAEAAAKKVQPVPEAVPEPKAEAVSIGGVRDSSRGAGASVRDTINRLYKKNKTRTVDGSPAQAQDSARPASSSITTTP